MSEVDLFGNPVETLPVIQEVKPVRKDWLNLAAKRKIKDCPEAWHWYKWDALEGGTIVEGALAKPDPNGGHKWPKPHQEYHKVIVTSSDLQAERDRYESETGNCSECCGTAQKWTGWHHETGDKFKPCDKCNATGKTLLAERSKE